ncbi:MAG: hypothetical protein MI861_28910, partial [Pirellulales bacterium]|nr:hypothetical protein [Pirellulales bacterium]
MNSPDPWVDQRINDRFKLMRRLEGKSELLFEASDLGRAPSGAGNLGTGFGGDPRCSPQPVRIEITGKLNGDTASLFTERIARLADCPLAELAPIFEHGPIHNPAGLDACVYLAFHTQGISLAALLEQGVR